MIYGVTDLELQKITDEIELEVKMATLYITEQGTKLRRTQSRLIIEK